MVQKLPANPIQMWLARGAIVVAIAMLIFLKSGAGSGVSSVHVGQATMYLPSPFAQVTTVVTGLLTLVLSIIFWMQRVRFYRMCSCGLFLLSAFVLFNAPTGSNHSVTVAADHFSERIGAWYSPTEKQVKFRDISYIRVKALPGNDGQNPKFELECLGKTGAISLPINDLLKVALPEILARAAQQDVLIGEDDFGWQIPGAIRSELKQEHHQ